MKDLELEWGNKNFRHLVLLPKPPFQLVIVFDESFAYCGFEVVLA